MNIFYLDENPFIAAKSVSDVHSHKMVLETAQLLCSAFEEGVPPYTRTQAQYNHPCAIWTRSSRQNFDWLVQYGISLAQEYNHRYNKIHKSGKVILWCMNNAHLLNLPDKGMTSIPLCMPEKYWCDDPVLAYRAYYIGEKSEIAKWNKGRKPPSWWPYKS